MLDALEQALHARRPAEGGRPGEQGVLRVDRAERRFPVVIATSFIGVLRRPFESAQYVSITCTERRAEAGIAPSVGSVGDRHDCEIIGAVRRT